MSRTSKYGLASLLLIPAVAIVVQRRAAGSQEEESTAIERGKYLVHHVAMCIQCHTPRDQKGDLIRERLLSGAPVPVKRPYADIEWAFSAPHIRGFPGYSEEQALRFLTEGVDQNGESPRAPMPPFRMTRDDAGAVIAYLKSLE